MIKKRGLAAAGALAVGAGMLVVPMVATPAFAGGALGCFVDTRTLDIKKVDAMSGEPLAGATFAVESNLPDLAFGYGFFNSPETPLGANPGARAAENPYYADLSEITQEHHGTLAAQEVWDAEHQQELDRLYNERVAAEEELESLLAGDDVDAEQVAALREQIDEQARIISAAMEAKASAENAYTIAEWEGDAEAMAAAEQEIAEAEAAILAAGQARTELIAELNALGGSSGRIAELEQLINDLLEQRQDLYLERPVRSDNLLESFKSLWMDAHVDGTRDAVEVTTDEAGLAQVEVLNTVGCNSWVDFVTLEPATITEVAAPDGYAKTDEVFTETPGEVLVIENERAPEEVAQDDDPEIEISVLPKVTAS